MDSPLAKKAALRKSAGSYDLANYMQLCHRLNWTFTTENNITVRYISIYLGVELANKSHLKLNEAAKPASNVFTE